MLRSPPGVAVRGTALAALLVAVSAATFSTSHASVPEARIFLRRLASDLASPLLLTAPPGDPRLFIVERAGRIRILENGQLRSQPFLDISALVGSAGEGGLLGLAFAPDYATSGLFYVDYTDTNGDTVIARYQVSADPDVADASSGETVLPIQQPQSNHNGGHLAFGPDAFLYIGTGDGGGRGLASFVPMDPAISGVAVIAATDVSSAMRPWTMDQASGRKARLVM